MLGTHCTGVLGSPRTGSGFLERKRTRVLGCRSTGVLRIQRTRDWGAGVHQGLGCWGPSAPETGVLSCKSTWVWDAGVLRSQCTAFWGAGVPS